jgi:hypothetical protein
MSTSTQFLRRITVAVALSAAFVGLAARPADARVFIGIGIPFPGFYPGPYYYPPPPVYYPPPPPVVYAPPQVYTPSPQAYTPGPQAYTPGPQAYTPGPQAYGAGQACYAGPYVCPMDRPVASGGSCYCPGNGGQRVWGRAN